MMEKFTDAEVVKALEYCASDIERCDECPLHSECKDSPFWDAKAKYALDLINRQKAEIESWKEQNVRLNKECDHFIRFASAAKSEAYKEFWEKLKREADFISGGDYGFSFEIREDVAEDIIKELD